MACTGFGRDGALPCAKHGQEDTMTRHLTVLMLALLVLGGIAWADPVCQSSVTLSDYAALGSGGCDIGSLHFSDFTYIGSGFGGATAIPADGVAVGLLTGNSGFLFSAAWSVRPGQGLDSLISYTVAGPIDSIGAAMAGYGAAGGGVVTVAETTDPAVGTIFLYHSTAGTLASMTIPVSVSGIRLTKDIAVNGNDGLAAVSEVTNSFQYQV